MTKDVVNRPAHYTRGKIEVRDFIADQGLNFNRGSAVKYIARAGFKDPSKEVEDLRKARSCIEHEIAMLEGGGAAERIIEREIEEIRLTTPPSIYRGDGQCSDCAAQAGEPHLERCPFVLTVPPASHLRLDSEPGAMGPTGNEAADVGQWRETKETADDDYECPRCGGCLLERDHARGSCTYGRAAETIEDASERRRAELDSDAPLNSYEWKGQR